jgi:hypothetical protein
MQNIISLDDVIASEAKFGCVLECDLKKVNDLKKIDPKCKYDITYIPLSFKHINGKLMKAKIKFTEIIIASSAKIPQGANDNIKHLTISFIKMSKKDIAGGDYDAKEKESEEKQIAENARVASNIERYEAYNTKFLKVLDIIDTSYKTVCDDLKSKEKELDFKLKKDRKQDKVNVCSIKQISRESAETNGDVIVLENPIYRLRISACVKNNAHKGKIGIWSNYHNMFKPTVFDTKKMTKKNNYQPVPAKVKVGGKLRSLDVNNASSFITYKSLIGGSITFDCISVSNAGLSLSNSFYDLYVFRHKSKAAQNAITNSEILAMRGGIDEDDAEDSDAEIIETDHKSDAEKVDADEEEYDDDEDGDADEPHDSDDDQSDKKPRGKK